MLKYAIRCSHVANCEASDDLLKVTDYCIITCKNASYSHHHQKDEDSHVVDCEASTASRNRGCNGYQECGCPSKRI